MSIVTAGIIAALYVLGVWQGRAFRESINMLLEDSGYEVDSTGSLLLTYLWPVGAIVSMFTSTGEE